MQSELPHQSHLRSSLSPSQLNVSHYLTSSSNTFSTTNEIEKLSIILSKKYESRLDEQNLWLNNWARNNTGLRQLSEDISEDFVKILMKNGQVTFIPKNSTVYVKGDCIHEMGMVISGKLSLLTEFEQTSNDEKQVRKDEVYDKLFQYAKIYSKQIKKKSSISLSTSRRIKSSNFIDPKSYSPLLNPEEIKQQMITSIINQNQFFGFADRSVGSLYLQNHVCLDNDTVILVFDVDHMMISLQWALKQKLKITERMIQQIACFSFLQSDKQGLIVQNLSLRKKKKAQLIYCQNSPSTHFYLLTQGEIKISKQTNLFIQDPNTLYQNRNNLIQQELPEPNQKNYKSKTKLTKPLLPYADFSNVFNYKPLKRNIEIGVITPFSLFGEQEFCQKKQRETSTICSSMHVEYYEIGIKKIEQIVGNKLIDEFCDKIKAMTRKKVLNRQSRYANLIHLQNKNHLNYFNPQEGISQKAERKFKLSKINSLIENRYRSPVKKQPQIKATYTNFNFHKFDKTPQKNKIVSKTQQKPRKHMRDHSQEQTSPEELKIMEMTHSWKMMNKRTDSDTLSNKKVSQYAIINIKKPLISSDFFKQINEKSRRISRQKQKRIADLGRSFNLKAKSVMERKPTNN